MTRPVNMLLSSVAVAAAAAFFFWGRATSCNSIEEVEALSLHLATMSGVSEINHAAFALSLLESGDTESLKAVLNSQLASGTASLRRIRNEVEPADQKRIDEAIKHVEYPGQSKD